MSSNMNGNSPKLGEGGNGSKNISTIWQDIKDFLI